MKCSFTNRLAQSDTQFGSVDGYTSGGHHFQSLNALSDALGGVHRTDEFMTALGHNSDMTYLLCMYSGKLVMLAGQIDESITPVGAVRYYGWNDETGRWEQLSDAEWSKRYMSCKYYTHDDESETDE